MADEMSGREDARMANAITLTLSNDEMGDATEDDYDRWSSYVASRIDDATGLDVTVEQARYGDVVSRYVDGATDDQADMIYNALQTLWNTWCSEGAP